MRIDRYKTVLNWVILLAPLAPYLLRPGFIGDYFYPYMGVYAVVLLLWGYARWRSWSKAFAVMGITAAVGLLLFSIVYFNSAR
ncbi:hypothetical protein [Spirosoma flavum]|uniref:Uncharacterized protein n=1 Tax=Spirosoma flavum TaxID=2048557 RepID=A0ABW6APL8_9BACT